MELINSIEQLRNNITQFEKYLASDNGDEERIKTLDLIRRGRNFVAYKVEGEYRFAPSRFLGYINNTILSHSKSLQKHGTYTTQRISKILKMQDCYHEKLNNLYLKYCNTLEIAPYNYNHTFWLLEGNFISEYNSNNGFSEGEVLLRKHKIRERNQTLVAQLKNMHIDNLRCCICGFDFEKVYGEIGHGYIEAHHTKPISQMKQGDKTEFSDMVLVCANCHRMIHSKSPDCYLVEELKQVLKNNLQKD